MELFRTLKAASDTTPLKAAHVLTIHYTTNYIKGEAETAGDALSALLLQLLLLLLCNEEFDEAEVDPIPTCAFGMRGGFEADKEQVALLESCRAKLFADSLLSRAIVCRFAALYLRSRVRCEDLV